MEFENYINGVLGSVIVFIVVWVIFFVYLKLQKKSIEMKWGIFIDLLRERLDHIPLLISLCEMEGVVLMNKELLIKKREEGWKYDLCDGKKMAMELEISREIDVILEKVRGNKNVKMAALAKSLDDINVKIERFEEKYNGEVRKYNGLVGSIFVRILFGLFGFKKVNVFDFEA